jgi:excinuclease ABC subunit B
MYKLKKPYDMSIDQEKSVNNIVKNFNSGNNQQILLGATGTGKTFIMANLIEQTKKPTLILAPNKTLAAQLYGDLKKFFPDNRVEYFISNFDYYRPESYVVKSDTYLEKESSSNHDIDILRHSATHSLITTKDTIVVASVSCIYGIGSPENYKNMFISINQDDIIPRDNLLRQLIELQYERNDIGFTNGCFRVSGEVVDIFPYYMQEQFIRITFFDEEIESIKLIDSITNQLISKKKFTTIMAASHYISDKNEYKEMTQLIRDELNQRLIELKDQNKILESQRLEQRVNYDIESINELGRCSGIENYSRYITKRPPGESPYTLMDYFGDNFLLIIDESHLTVPQVGAMYKGDLSRKTSLVEYGYRLPSALDNRPLKFEEFTKKLSKVVYVSATPGDYELNLNIPITEQIIRPTGLIDPEIQIMDPSIQVDFIISELNKIKKDNQRMLVTTLTKKMSEDLTKYLTQQNIKVAYLHSDVKSFERTIILNDLRRGKYDLLIGINLLREGLDLPEVSRVIILDADKEGFLRNERSLIQTIGRAARNASGKVFMFADRITGSMQKAIDETQRRREIQIAFNLENKITPQDISKGIDEDLYGFGAELVEKVENHKKLNKKDTMKLIKELESKMHQAAKNLEFAEAAKYRDMLIELKISE